jgi:hypothetical protein
VDGGFAAGDECNPVDVGGEVCVLVGGGGGAKGTFRGGIEELEVGVAGEVDDPVNGDLSTCPGGGDSFIAGPTGPGRTTGVGTFALGFLFSARPLYMLYTSLAFIGKSNHAERKFSSYSCARNGETGIDSLPLTSSSRRN